MQDSTLLVQNIGGESLCSVSPPAASRCLEYPAQVEAELLRSQLPRQGSAPVLPLQHLPERDPQAMGRIIDETGGGAFESVQLMKQQQKCLGSVET